MLAAAAYSLVIADPLLHGTGGVAISVPSSLAPSPRWPSQFYGPDDDNERFEVITMGAKLALRRC